MRAKRRIYQEGEAAVHIVPTTANYHRFLAISVSGRYAPVVVMPRVNLEEPISSGYPATSPHGINLEEPGQGGQPT